jgi:hypothetical protein
MDVCRLYSNVVVHSLVSGFREVNNEILSILEDWLSGPAN